MKPTTSMEQADPELAALFDHFAFDETPSYGTLDARTRMLTLLASLVAAQAVPLFRVMLDGALTIGITPVEAKEVVYQAVPYCGMARVFPFLQAANEVLVARGVSLPLEGQSTTTPETRFDRGLAVQKHIFGDRIDQMYATAPANQIHIQRALSGNCFGDHVARGGLDLVTRELLTFAMLATLGGCESQLKGHIQGNVNLGTEKLTLLTVITQLIPYIGYPRSLNALACVNEVLPEPKREG